MIDRYRWSGGEEHILRFGVNHELQIIVFQPLFEEANRIRHILVQAMRALDELGIGSSLPDLPGTGESQTDIFNVDFDQWQLAAAAAASHVQAQVTASFRGAALLDDVTGTRAYWRCAPETGQRLVRDLLRTKLGSPGEGARSDTLILAGNRVQQELVDAIAAVVPASPPLLRTVRLETDPAEADARIAGSPVWRRSEPGDDPAFCAAIVADLAAWTRQCAE